MTQQLTDQQLQTLQTVTTMIAADFSEKEAKQVLLMLSSEAREIAEEKKIEKYLSAVRASFRILAHTDRVPVLQVIEIARQSFHLTCQPKQSQPPGSSIDKCIDSQNSGEESIVPV